MPSASATAFARQTGYSLLHGRVVGGARDRTGEAAGVAPGRDGPGVLLGVELCVHGDIVEPHTQHVGDDLGEHGAVALSLGDGIRLHRDRADGVDGDSGASRGAAFGPARFRSSGVRAVVM